LLVQALAACAPHERRHSVDEPPARVVPPPPAPAPPPVTRKDPPAPPTLSAVLEPAVLRTLESSGFTLSELVLERQATSAAELAALPGWKSIIEGLRADLAEVKRTHPLAKVTSIDGFRLFDERFLSSREMRFELTGVFNRLDRRAFYVGTCGEVRFVYRLRYETQQGEAPMGSRLPMTVNVVFLVSPTQTSCAEVARSWQPRTELAPPELSAWLLAAGPLSSKARAQWTLKSVETNLQTFRIQSSVNVSMAGHIEYSLRVFHPANAERTAFSPAPMENMPDVAALERDPSLRAELLSYLKQADVLAAVDRGTLNLPERFLAKRATSFSPRGLARPDNRPFRSLFAPSDFDGVALDGYRTITTGAALLRRLDGASCTGCHQSRTLAGFHHLGLDEEGPRGFTLTSGMSPHLEDDLVRRREYVATLAGGGTPDEFRPLPERQGAGRGFGAPCGLGDRGFAEWTCDTGLTCRKQEDPEIGVCTGKPDIGAACEYGTVVPGNKPHRDRIEDLTRHACTSGHVCIKNFSGFPQGTCGSSCDEAGDAGTCAELLDVDGFQNCLRGRKPFDTCAREFVLETGLRACDAENPCRQDYVCARTAEGRDACVPPYFVYQLRLDGYPLKK
jgi:hypothetical protein